MKYILNSSLIRVFAFVVLASISVRQAGAVPKTYLVVVDTSSVSGTVGHIDFQFNPGNATTQAASAVVGSFNLVGGSLTGVPQVTGSVSGALPGTITFTNSTALNEVFQGVTFGTTLSFEVTFSGPAIDTPNGTATAGSTFGIGLYDSNQNPILTNQGATTGFAGQVDINLNGTTTATAFPRNNMGGTSVVTFVPVDVDFLYFFWFFAS